MPTYLPKVDPSARKWFVLDANNVVLGKLAVTAANILTGKRKPTYTPFLDTGDHLIVLNAARVHLTGRKETESSIGATAAILAGSRRPRPQSCARRSPSGSSRRRCGACFPRAASDAPCSAS